MAAAIVTVASVVWVMLLLLQAWPALAARINEVRIPYLLLGLVLSIASGYMTFEAFATLASAVGIAGIPHHQLAHLHFTGQLLKHLPGRVWGVGYQWAAGKSAGTLRSWVLVNLGHMVLATFFALWSAWLAIALLKGTGWGLLALMGGLMIYLISWLLVSSRTLQRWASHLPGKAGSSVESSLAVFGSTPNSARIRIFLIFCVSWMLFYLAWIAFGISYSALGAEGGARLCAYYMLAWFAGYVTLLTPSGLGVRELVFAWLAQDFPVDAIALMAIVGRVSLLVVDVLLGMIFAPFAPHRGR